MNQLCYGRILHADPHANKYSVAMFGQNRGIVHGVSFSGASSSHTTGYKDLFALVPGTNVVLLQTRFNTDYRIISVVEFDSDLPLEAQPFSVIPSDVSIGAWQDPLLKLVTDPPRNHSDAVLYAGAAGSVNEFGVGFGGSTLHSFLRASEICGVDAFLQDNLLRIKGYNIQTWSAMGERAIETSGDTVTDSEEKAWFVHEGLGRNTGTEKFEVRSCFGDLFPDAGNNEKGQAAYNQLVLDVASTNDSVSRYKLAAVQQKYEQIQKDHPQCLPRQVTLAGYLGHGVMDLVTRPGSQYVPPELPMSTATGLDPVFSSDYLISIPDNKAHIPVTSGLSEVQRTADGRVRIASAKGVSLVKELDIPVPHRSSHDPVVDESNFTNPPLPDVELPPSKGSRMAARKDLRYRMLDRRNIDAHPAWEFDEDCDSVLAKFFEEVYDGVDYSPGPLSKHEFDTPDSTEMEVDPSTTSRYYQGRAGLHITDDGSVVIFDAYGASLILSGGNIYAQCPGDIFQLPGRDATTWAGRGVHIKSQDDAEIVSSSGNVRVKAEDQVSVIGGASGTDGGILLQSKGLLRNPTVEGKEFSTGGIVLKSATHVSVETPYTGIRSDTIYVTGMDKPTEVAVNGLVAATTVTANDIDVGVLFAVEAMVTHLQATQAKIADLDAIRAYFDIATAIIFGAGSIVVPGGTIENTTFINDGTILCNSVSAVELTAAGGEFGGVAAEAYQSMQAHVVGGGEVAELEEIVAGPITLLPEEPTQEQIEAVQELFALLPRTQPLPPIVVPTKVLPAFHLPILGPVLVYYEGKVDLAGGLIAPDAEFSYNSSDEYGVGGGYDFKITEAMWQTVARLTGASKVWKETSISSGEYGMPFPGRTTWEGSTLEQPVENDLFLREPTDSYTYDFTTASLADAFIIT